MCKEFFLKTLDISQRRVSYFFERVQNTVTGVPRSPMKGKNTKKFTNEEHVSEVRQHIQSYPMVESHYTRAESKRKFLEGTLNLSMMYSMYKKLVANPVKENIYRKIFNSDFNISFQKPKKDRCDLCEENRFIVNPTTEQVTKFTDHTSRKLLCKTERDNDREMYKEGKDLTTAVVCFDLENVFALPRAHASNFFYKRKCNSYNLTAHCSTNSKSYCAIWNEFVAGRAGNHIACALTKILKQILIDLPSIEKVILWSDSCTPQNRNQVMTMALKYFLHENPSLKEMHQKYSEPGHGNIQEVDAVHSKIERFLKNAEIFSPVSLQRQLNRIAEISRKPMQIIEMKASDFHDYQTPAKTYNFSVIPYTRICTYCIKSSEPSVCNYKTTFSENYTTATLLNRYTPRNKSSNKSHIILFPKLKLLTGKTEISSEKRKDIMSMLKYMPPVDANFFRCNIIL